MVVLSIVRDNSECIMRRSNTSVHLKANAARRSSLQAKSPYFWNASVTNQETPRKSLPADRPDTANRVPFRRRSIDCTYHIWDLADATEGMKNIKVIDMSDNDREGARKANHIFPPISAKSLRNPRLQSAKSSSRSENNTKKRTMRNGFSYANNKKDSLYTSNELLASEHSNTDDFCHGLPNESKRNSSDTGSLRRSQNAFSFGSKKDVSSEEQQALIHSRTTKIKASSVRSRSSEDSGSSMALRAKATSRRRLSLPVTPSPFAPAKSREFHKAVKELSRQGEDLNARMKKSQTAPGLKTRNFSDKASTPVVSTTPRDALTISSGKRRDSLHRIEEIPVEMGTPVFTLNEESRDECGVACPDNCGASNKPGVGSNPAVIDRQDSLCLKTEQASNTSVPAEVSDIQANSDGMNSISADHQMGKVQAGYVEKKVTHLSKKALDAAANPIHPKVEIIVDSSTLDDDGSVIDASILAERDEDLCDSDFREKRIIQWIIAAETGDNVEQQVESAISPSPTQGNRETAITVIYDG